MATWTPDRPKRDDPEAILNRRREQCPGGCGYPVSVCRCEDRVDPFLNAADDSTGSWGDAA